MKIRKFFAGSSREALRMVREALGPDAVVLSNRAIDGGVELVALAENDLASLAHLSEHAAPRTSTPQPMRPQPRTSEEVRPYDDTRQPAPYPNRALPDPFASTFGAPAAIADQQAYAHTAQATRYDEPAVLQPPASTGRPSDARYPGHGGTAAGVSRFRAEANPALERVVERAVERSLRQPSGAPEAAGFAGDAVAERFHAPQLGAAEHVVRAEPQPLTPATAMAKRLGVPGERIMPVAALPSAADSAAANGIAHGAVNGAVTAAESGDRLNQGLPASVTAFAVPPVRAAGPAAPVAPAAEVAAAQPRASYSVRTTVSASLGTPFNLGAPSAAAAAGPEAGPAASPATEAEAVPARAPADEPAAPKRDLAAEIAAVPVDEAQVRVAEMVAQNVIGEIHSMRGLLEEQLAGLLWSDRQRREPVRGQAAKSLLAAGFSAQLVKLLIERMPTQTDHAQAMEWLKAALERNLPVLQNEDALLERGGVYALMGPTGVGKTTTTAKLAARCVMRYGADRVALLTTDSYRIGAHEQLRIYGKILGVGVHAVKDAADLRLALSELRNKHMVLIDTIGMSQRDRTVSEQVAMLCGTGMPVQRLLLLNATSHGDTLNEVVQAYRNRQAEGHPDLAGCILTKLDEATNIGAVLDTVIRYRLPVHYVSTGQKVPENLYVARKEFLMKSAFCVSRENSPFVPAEDELAAMMAAVPARASAELSEVRFG